MRQTLGWMEKDENGHTVDVEATRDRNVWTLRRRATRRDEWDDIPQPTAAQWTTLLDLLERKYHRRRCAWRDVEQVQLCLAQALEQEPNT